MSGRVRSKKREDLSVDKTAITLRLDDELYQIVHLIGAERRESLNVAIQFILADWWKGKPERERARYEQFLGRKLLRG